MKRCPDFLRFLLGGGLYCLTELLWRRFTHVSMFVLGGLCFLLLARIGRLRRPLLLRALLGAAAVTVLEFFSGLLLNRALRLQVWDYSGLRFQLLGQISLLYAALWIPLCAAGIQLNRLLDGLPPRPREAP